jgi:hypothetical protein
VLQVVDEVLALMKVPASSTAKAKAVAVERYRDTRSPEMSLAAFEKAMQASLAAIDGGLSDTEREEAMKAARFAFERERISAADKAAMVGRPAIITAVIQVTRAQTGKVEEYEIVGTAAEEPETKE